jgi:ketosteroid isomerase-like protein
VKIRIGIGLAVAFFVVGLGISRAQKADIRADEQAIRKLDQEWSAALGAKDIAKGVSYYAEEASAFPYNAPIATGKEQIKTLFTGLMSLPGFALSFTPTRIEVSKAGDVAYDIGTFLLTTNDAKGNPTSTPGKYVVVWKKQADKNWKAVADIFNTDK